MTLREIRDTYGVKRAKVKDVYPGTEHEPDADTFRKRPRLEPLDSEAVLWVAAFDRVPIEERIEWVARMKRQVDAINETRRAR